MTLCTANNRMDFGGCLNRLSRGWDGWRHKEVKELNISAQFSYTFCCWIYAIATEATPEMNSGIFHKQNNPWEQGSPSQVHITCELFKIPMPSPTPQTMKSVLEVRNLATCFWRLLRWSQFAVAALQPCFFNCCLLTGSINITWGSFQRQPPETSPTPADSEHAKQ